VGISQATRQRIIQVAADLNYRPNAVARSLRSKVTNVVAFYNAQDGVFDPRYPFYASILAGVQAGCAEQHKHLLIHGNFEDQSDDDIFLMLHNGQIDGLVLYVRAVSPLVERLIESHLPVVTVAEQVPGLPYVGIDEEQGGRLLARHLAARGYQRVLYRTGEEELIPLTQRQRMEAFRDEATALGLTVTVVGSNPKTNMPSPEEEKLLLSKAAERPEVVACWGDVSADGIAAFCMKHGVRIPQDIALVGFDDLPSTQRPSLRLTTIHAPWSEVACTAIRLLVAQCEGKKVPTTTILPVELVEGDTT
jgi:DNA-binding LacI/PurR family transcriptional regulator